MATPDLSLFGKVRSIADFDREAEEFMRRKQEAALDSQIKQQALASAATKADLDREKFQLEKQEYQDKLSGRGGGSIFEGTGYDQQVTNLVYNDLLAQGVDPQTAAKRAVDKVMGSKTTSYADPVTGQRITESRRPIFGVGAAQPPATPQPNARQPMTQPAAQSGMDSALGASDPYRMEVPSGPDLYQSAETGTGAIPAASDFVARTIGQFSPDVVDNDVIQARNAMKNLERRITTALAISGRPPVFEQTLLRNLSPDTGVLESPARAKAVLQNIHQELLRQYNSDVEAYDNISLPAKTRQALIQRAEQTRRILSDFGDPARAFGSTQQPAQSGGGWSIRKVE